MSELGDFVDDLIVCGEDVVRELDLTNRLKAIQAHAECNGSNSPLRQRGIKHSVGAMLLLQPVCGTEYASEVSYIFSKDKNILIP